MRTVLVTGATGLVARNLVGDLLRRGNAVVAVARSDDGLKALADEAAGSAGTLFRLAADLLSTPAGAIVDWLTARELFPDGLVNAARDGRNLLVGDDIPTRLQWTREFELGVMVPAELTIALANQPGSRLRAVVNLASMYGVVAVNPNLYESPGEGTPVHYGVVKAAVIHLTRELAVRLAGRGIRVNAVSFGGVEGRADKPFQRRYATLSPMGRMLSPAEVAGPIDFLLSDAAAATTGHNLVADGGWTLW
jgi:NAD(P)-dependent dehydrogenase (short-subunit alcohol dehydrogenase family)